MKKSIIYNETLNRFYSRTKENGLVLWAHKSHSESIERFEKEDALNLIIVLSESIKDKLVIFKESILNN